MHHLTPARRRRTGLALALSAVLTLGAAACGGSSDNGDSDGDESVAEVSGGRDTQEAAVLGQPKDKPDFILTDTQGKEYDFVKRTEGKPTLLYFGYTNCPDVCPLTMSNIDIAKSKLPKADQDKLQVVFVTTDPEHDTPKELGKWLKGAAPGSVGLTGDFDTIQAGARTLGISIEPPKKDKNGETVSAHGSQVYYFSPKDDMAHVLYTEDVTAETYTKDLPKLVKGETP